MDENILSIQISPVSFIDEGVDSVLDFLQGEIRLNTLLLTTHSFTFGTLGRSVEGSIPDHGVQKETRFEGGSLVKNDPRYYTGVNIKEFAARDPELAGYDVLAEVLEPARKRGLKVYSRFAENSFEASLPRVVPGFPRLLAIDCLGRRVNSPCFNHPDYRNWYLAAVEDHVKSYPIDGVCFGAEGAGPLHHLFTGGAVPRCFCDHCLEKAHRQGIDADRAREGMERLWRFVEETEGIPSEGFFISVLRIIMNWPELLQWEKLYIQARQSLRKEIYGVIKSIDSALQVSWHLWHTITYDPIFRAQTDYSIYPEISDWIKPAIYHACASMRMRTRVIDPHQHRLWRDLDPTQLTQLYYAILGFKEAPYEKMMGARFSADYVGNDIKRIAAATGGRVPICPGIDIDIPDQDPEVRSEPEDITAVLKAVFDAGAQGFVLSRKYSEMRLKNLRAVGDFIREELE